jgi:shikimate kinase
MEVAVMTASHGAMASLLEKLCDLLTDKYMLLKETKEQIVFLKDELDNMYAFLKKMSDTEEPNEQAKCWAKEIHELSYDIEDSINDFLHHVEHEANSKPHGFKGFINRMMNLLKTISTQHEIAQEFHGLKRRVMEVSERRMRYKIDDAVPKPNNTNIDLRLLAMYAQSAGLVGVDGPRDELIQLMDTGGVPAYQLKVVSIVGFGGLGKTTLANQVYHKLEGEFQCRTFVSVSQKPNIRKILRTILYHVGFNNASIQTWEDYELISALQKFLSDKRYTNL